MTESAIATLNPAPLSSVQIEQAAKGSPRVTVKVYAADAEAAMFEATRLYDLLVGRYSESIQP